MRSNHEVIMLQAVRGIKEQQLKEAQTNLEALNKTRDIIPLRFSLTINA
jgi:hypothetical protein